MRWIAIFAVAVGSSLCVAQAQSPESPHPEDQTGKPAVGTTHINPYSVDPSSVPVTEHEPKPETVTSTSPAAEITEHSLTAEISALQSALESAAEMTEEVRAECTARLEKAKSSLQTARKKSGEREQAENELAAVPEKTAAIRRQLAEPVDIPMPEFPPAATVALLESRLDELRGQLEAAQADAAAAQQRTDTRATRINKIATEIQEVEQRLTEASAAIDTMDGNDLTARTTRLEQQARLLALQRQLPALKAQRNLLEATTELMPLQRDFALRKESATKKLLRRWEEAVTAWRQDESKRQVEQARRIAQQSHPALRSLAIRNAMIAELRMTAADGIKRIAKQLNEIDQSSTQLAEQFVDLRSKVEHAGATTSTGILMRKLRSELPSHKSFQARNELVAEEMPSAHLKLMELQQLRRDVADVDEAVATMMQSLPPTLREFDQAKVHGVIKRLLKDRRSLLLKAEPDQDTYLQDLNELDLANKALEKQVDEMRAFLDQRVLWMRSNEALNVANLREAARGLKTLLTPSRWAEVVRVCIGDLVRRPAAGLLVVTLLVLAVICRANLLARQRSLCELPPFGEPIRFSQSVLAFALTFVVSIRWPLLLAAIGYRAQYAADATPWTKAVGAALMTTILFVWGLELISEWSSRHGIGQKLFGWSPEVITSIRATADTSLLLGAPLFAILQLTHWQETPEMQNLQRVMFITILLLIGFQIAWLVRPGGNLMTTLRRQSPDALVYRMRRAIWILSSAAPLAFAGMSVIGYHFSAFQLSGRLAENGAAIVAVIIAYAMALWWVRTKAYNREIIQLMADRQSASDLANREDHIDANADQQAIRATASQEAQDLLRYAAIIALACVGWFIWSDVLPALRIFDQVELWQNLVTVSETVMGTDGSESIETFERTVPTTLTHVLTAIVICIVTIGVSRRLPSLLELTVLDRLPLDQGGRQAIAILVRYAATLTGMLLACNAIKLSWESVQWLAAAMTVGLGFGLQEIFANLVSGLIILFERPIRAGDLVTVDEVTGHVSRMQMRTTTITDFDRREYIVPNKRFITDNVINWTLSDPISRVVLPVGVAYGTDVDQVHEILIQIARREPLVLREPAPMTVFKGFGDSTLDFDLRVFIPKRDLYIDVVNRINGQIAREFAKAHVEIAFPQLDLHLKHGEILTSLEETRGQPTSDLRVDADHQQNVAAPSQRAYPRQTPKVAI